MPCFLSSSFLHWCLPDCTSNPQPHVILQHSPALCYMPHQCPPDLYLPSTIATAFFRNFNLLPVSLSLNLTINLLIHLLPVLVLAFGSFYWSNITFLSVNLSIFFLNVESKCVKVCHLFVVDRYQKQKSSSTSNTWRCEDQFFWKTWQHKCSNNDWKTVMYMGIHWSVITLWQPA